MNAFRRIAKIVSTIVVGFAIVLAIALVGVRLIGLDVYTVLSGSMEPAYKTGSVIWVADREPEEIQVGDPITFVMNEDLMVATHRVIEIDAENQCFFTQGDANDAPDGSPVHFENLIGEPVFTVPYLGYLVSYVQSPPGCYVAIAACALLLLLMLLPELFSKDEGELVRAEAKRRERQAVRTARSQRAGAPGRHAPQAHSGKTINTASRSNFSSPRTVARSQPQDSKRQKGYAQISQQFSSPPAGAAVQKGNPRLRVNAALNGAGK